MKVKIWFEELTTDQFNTLCEVLDDVDGLRLYWFVQTLDIVVVEGELFAVNNDPAFTLAQLQHMVEES